jgi:DNA mismatch repair ATPase MutS
MASKALSAFESRPEAPLLDGATPVMAQFLEIKAANADCLLFYRMGDFYELFFEDAEIASRALGIALTKRGKHQGEDIPMCGVPVRAADDYLQRLIAQGHRVAVCEQLEDPAEARKRGSKSVVRRDVVRLVTPGTLTEESLLDARAHNFLTALFRGAQEGGETLLALASLDISTGELIAASVRGSDLAGELARLKPGEVLVGDDLAGDAKLRARIEEAGAALTPCPRAHFDSQKGERLLKSRLGVAALDAFGEFSRAELAALAGLLTYVEITQVGKAPLLRPPRKESAGSLLVIDAATRANLELVRSNQGSRAGSLLAAIDRTVTAAGARELASRLGSPLAAVEAVNARLDAVSYLADEPRLRQMLREELKAAPDLARALARLSLARGGPRDLGAVRDAIRSAKALAASLIRAGSALGLPLELGSIAEHLEASPAGVEQALEAALAESLPVNARDGGFIRACADDRQMACVACREAVDRERRRAGRAFDGQQPRVAPHQRLAGLHRHQRGPRGDDRLAARHHVWRQLRAEHLCIGERAEIRDEVAGLVGEQRERLRRLHRARRGERREHAAQRAEHVERRQRRAHGGFVDGQRQGRGGLRHGDISGRGRTESLERRCPAVFVMDEKSNIDKLILENFSFRDVVSLP